MQNFANYLISKQIVSKKVSHFYRLWVINLYDYIGRKPGKTIKNSDIDRYINHITKSKMEWKVKGDVGSKTVVAGNCFGIINAFYIPGNISFLLIISSAINIHKNNRAIDLYEIQGTMH